MQSYKELYFYMFRAMAEATFLIEQGNVILACETLIAAQQVAEEAHLEVDILPEI